MEEQIPRISFKDVLIQGRADVGLSIKEAAERCGCSHQQWRHYEHGTNRPPIERLEGIANTIGVPATELFALWSIETLDPNGSSVSPIANKLNRWVTGPRVGRQSLSSAERRTAIASAIPSGIADLRIDPDVEEYALRAAFHSVQELIRYRSKITSRSALRTVLVDEKECNPHWQPLPGCRKTRHVLVGAGKGIGYVATALKLEPRTCLFRASPSPLSGVAIFTIISGEAIGLYEEDTKWAEYERLPAGQVGAFHLGNGFALINNSDDVLLLSLVSMPMEPNLRVSKVTSRKDDSRICDISLAEFQNDPGVVQQPLRTRLTELLEKGAEPDRSESAENHATVTPTGKAA